MHRPNPAQHPKAAPDLSLFGLMKAAYRSAVIVTQNLVDELEQAEPPPAWNRRERRRRLTLTRRNRVHPLLGTPGKINFRRSDPRHQMYDVLRARGYEMDNRFGGICVDATKGGVRKSAVAAMQVETLPVPKCLAYIAYLELGLA